MSKKRVRSQRKPRALRRSHTEFTEGRVLVRRWVPAFGRHMDRETLGFTNAM